MALREYLGPLGTAVLIVIVVAMLIGFLTGQPFLLGYVTTESMEPALSPGDGFIAIPSALTGAAQPGDIVVFEAETIQGGGLTTHRVVDVTEEGYETRGDANPFTDQDGGEPYVTEDQIVAHALQIGGWLVVIPFLGTAISGLQTIISLPFGLFGTDNVGTVMVGVGIVLFVLAGAFGGGVGRDTERSRARENVIAVWLIVLLAAGVVTVAATAAMAVPAGDYDIEIIVSGEPGGSSQIVAPGRTATATYDVHNSGFVPTLLVTDPLDEGMSVDPAQTVLGFGERQEVAVSMVAPTETGEYTRQVRESRYLMVLPRSVLLTLHAMHPYVAMFVVDLVAAVFVVSIALAVFGTGYLRVRPSPDVPIGIRLSRRLRRLW